MSNADGAASGSGKADPSVIFTPAIEAMQSRLGSREQMARMAETRGFGHRIDENLAGFLATRDSVYFATASAAGQPYIQHRGGEPGFIIAIDERTLAFAEQHGTRQYVSFGDLSENPRAHIFAMDYPGRQRIKIWGAARMIERTGEGAGAEHDDARVWARLPEDAERAIVFRVEAWDVNCPKFIRPRYTASDIEQATIGLRREIADQAAEIQRLQAIISAQASR